MRSLFFSFFLLAVFVGKTQNLTLSVKEAPGGKISKTNLTSENFPSFLAEKKPVKTSHFIITCPSPGKPIEFKCDGKLDNEVKRILANLEEGSVITITHIEYVYSSDEYEEDIVSDQKIELTVTK